MKNIPNIPFESKGNAEEFELLNLTTLFVRMAEGLGHDSTHPHRITFFALLIVTKGEGKHQVDLKEYDLKKGTVLKIAKGQVHAFQKDPQYEGFLIIFTESFVLNYFSKSTTNLITHFYDFHLSTPISNNQADNERFLKELLIEVDMENNYAQKNIIAALLSLYLLRLERQSQNLVPNNKSKHYHTFILFKNLVEANFSTTRNVNDYANMLFISSKKINLAVKNYTLNTAKTFIDNYVLLEAQRAIVSTEKSLKEIAFETGFEEVSNFTKFFKKNAGISPKAFRLKQLK